MVLSFNVSIILDLTFKLVFTSLFRKRSIFIFQYLLFLCTSGTLYSSLQYSFNFSDMLSTCKDGCMEWERRYLVCRSRWGIESPSLQPWPSASSKEEAWLLHFHYLSLAFCVRTTDKNSKSNQEDSKHWHPEGILQ